jgi:hypothetical protein
MGAESNSLSIGGIMKKKRTLYFIGNFSPDGRVMWVRVKRYRLGMSLYFPRKKLRRAGFQPLVDLLERRRLMGRNLPIRLAREGEPAFLFEKAGSAKYPYVKVYFRNRRTGEAYSRPASVACGWEWVRLYKSGFRPEVWYTVEVK